MILELLQALVAALLVVWLPGVGWSRLLWGTNDLLGRGVMAVGLSLCLVPAAAVGLAALLGSGVTLTIAVAAPLGVGMAGLLACRLLGTAPAATASPLLGTSSALGAPALLSLAGAAALMLLAALRPRLATALGPPTLLLILAAALPSFLQSRAPRRDALPGERPNDPVVGRDLPADARSPALRRAGALGVVLALALALTVVRGYVGPVLHDWPYIRGADQYAHAVMTELVLKRGSAGEFLVYPPGFHALIAVSSRLSGLRPLELFPLLAPAVLLLPALAAYTLAGGLFGPACGVVAAAIAGLLLNSPWQFLSNATYADLLAAQFLLPLGALALAVQIVRPTGRGGALAAVLGGAVVLYHPVASLYAALLALGIAVLVLPPLLLRDRRRGVWLLGTLGLLGLLAAAFAWGPYDLPGTVGSLLGLRAPTGAAGHAAIALGTQAPLPVAELPPYLGQAVVWLGLLGLGLLLGELRGFSPSWAAAAALLPVWTLLMFAGSLTSLSGFPTRFSRDLGAPLAALAALALVRALMAGRVRSQLSLAAGGLLALVCALGAYDGLARASRPSPSLLMTPGIEAAGEWLRTHNGGGNLLVSPVGNQASVNALLALGGYSGLPGYTEEQTEDPRVVPPRDRAEVLAGLRVLRDPGDRRALAGLARYDVRRVALLKRLRPGSYWARYPPADPAPFRRLPALYRPVFENAEVAIFEVRGGGARGSRGGPSTGRGSGSLLSARGRAAGAALQPPVQARPAP